jgi:type III pantothenate kinase
MSLLCADIGNSHTVAGLLDTAPDTPAEVVAHWRVATDERRTSDEWALLLRGLVGTAEKGEITGMSVCSAVPSVLHEWRDMVSRHFPGIPCVFVEPGIRTGVPILMDNPREVGADRIVNALAATALYGGPAIVVDLGTATTFDVVSAEGKYVGGAIAPGIEISAEALGRRGAQLRRVELARPRSVIAKNTVEALQSGMLHGTAAQVDGLVARMIEELGVDRDEVTVVATGHLAPLVVAECRSLDHLDPWLTLRGLALVFARNS